MWKTSYFIGYTYPLLLGTYDRTKKSLGTKRIEFGFSSTSTQGTMMFDLSKKQHYDSTSNFVNKHLNFNFILFHYFCCANKHHFVFFKDLLPFAKLLVLLPLDESRSYVSAVRCTEKMFVGNCFEYLEIWVFSKSDIIFCLMRISTKESTTYIIHF